MKPDKVKVGQIWNYIGMQGKPFYVLSIETQKDCTPLYFPAEVEWAVFRKNKKQPCHDMLSNPRWVYLGENIQW